MKKVARAAGAESATIARCIRPPARLNSRGSGRTDGGLEMRKKQSIAFRAGGTLAFLATTATALAANGFSQQGSYRPVEGQTSSGNAQGQFAPVQNRSNAQRWTSTQPLPSPALPTQPQVPATSYVPGGYGVPAHPQPSYAPAAPRYDNRGWNPPPLPDPTNILDNFFGTRRNDTAGSYLPPPVPPVPAPVAPVYNPPVPAAPPQPPAYGGYGYSYPAQQQVPTGYPFQQQVPANYPVQQQVPTSYPGQQNWSLPAGSTYVPPVPAQPQQAAPAPQQAAASAPKPAPKPAAPRPFSNPQESGNSFSPRSITIQPGRNDSRFRPPELKGTP